MTTPNTTLWKLDPHTAAKHQMLDSYLQAWFPIMSATFRELGATYVDAFAGPGEYLDGELGSPFIALRQALRADVTKYHSPLRLLFIEERRDRHEHLQKLIATNHATSSYGHLLSVRAVHGPCEQYLIPLLADFGAHDSPIFVNFDGWGVDTPLSLVRHIGRRTSSEVLITFGAMVFAVR